MVRPTTLAFAYWLFENKWLFLFQQNSTVFRGESNAVVYSNSILGARTEKYADYFDILAALVGVGESLQLYT